MNNDSTLTLDQRLAQHEAAYERNAERAYQDSLRQKDVTETVRHYDRAKEDFLKERERMLWDDFTANPDEWELVGVWFGHNYNRAEIDAQYTDDYHHVENHGMKGDKPFVALYRKAAQS